MALGHVFHNGNTPAGTLHLWSFAISCSIYGRASIGRGSTPSANIAARGSGPLWETINLVVMLIGLTPRLVVDLRQPASPTSSAYVGLGIIIWSAVSSLVIEGAGAFVRNAGYVTNSTLSVDLYVGRSVFKTMITFGHHVILYFVGVVFALVPLGWTQPARDSRHRLAVRQRLLGRDGARLHLRPVPRCRAFRAQPDAVRVFRDAGILELSADRQQSQVHRRVQRAVLFHRDHPRSTARGGSAALRIISPCWW